MDGASQAFAEVFDQHYRGVCRYVAARADPDLVEDVAAETFLVAWRRQDELPREPRAWLLGTAARCLANHRRTQHRAARLGEKVAALATPVSPTVEQALEQTEQGRALIAALASLREPEREVLLLHHWDGLAAREIAAVLGCSRVVARARLHRASRRLQDALTLELSGGAPAGQVPELNPTTWASERTT